MAGDLVRSDAREVGAKPSRDSLSVFEVHGVAVRRRNIGGEDMPVRTIIVREGAHGVVIDPEPGKTVMSPCEARRLARSLYRCARRFEARTLDGRATTPPAHGEGGDGAAGGVEPTEPKPSEPEGRE